MLSLKRIAKIATDLLNELGMVAPYVGVEEVARHLSLSLQPSLMEDETSGMLVVKNGKAAIGFNHSHSEVRKRFTIAHEIGHYVLHHQKDGLVENLFFDKGLKVYRRTDTSAYDNSDFKRETEANAFAANLLMPEFMIKSEVEKYDSLSDEDIQELADEFKVSSIAMTYRLKNLGIVSLY